MVTTLILILGGVLLAALAVICFRIRNAGSGRRSHRGRGDYHRPTGDRSGSADQNAGALDQIRNGYQHRSSAIEEHQSARASAGVVQRGQPGPTGEREADQRSAARLQQGVPLAEGEKDQRIREADGYRLKRINEAEGDVARFSALLAEYIKAPIVTRRRIYIETLQDVMPGIRSKIIVDEQTRSILPLLNLDSQKGERP